jgi:hypothetical protein
MLVVQLGQELLARARKFVEDKVNKYMVVVFRSDQCPHCLPTVNSIAAYIPHVIPSREFRDVAFGDCNKCQAVVQFLGEVTGYTVSQLSILKQKK